MICFISRFSRLSDESPASHFPEVAALSRDHLRDARSHKAQKQKCFYRVFHGEMEKYERIMVPILRLANKASRNWNRGLNRGNPSRVVWFKLGCLVGPQAVSSSLWPQLLFFIVSAWLQYIVERTFPLQFTFHLSIKPWNRNFGVSSALSRNWEMERHFWWMPLERSSQRFTSRRKKNTIQRRCRPIQCTNLRIWDGFSYWFAWIFTEFHPHWPCLFKSNNQVQNVVVMSMTKTLLFQTRFQRVNMSLISQSMKWKVSSTSETKKTTDKDVHLVFGSTYFFKTTVTLKR